MIKILQISDKLFWGFHVIIDLDDYKSFDSLSSYIKEELIKFLTVHNLLMLVDEAKKLNLHNHEFNNYEDLYKSTDEIIYFCASCCSYKEN
jgi:hypothetical protein